MTVGFASTRPVSLSYRNVIKCFPELTDEDLSFKVDLNQLKDLIDEKFVTSRSQLMLRQVSFVDNGQKKRLSLRIKDPQAHKAVYLLAVEKIDDKGIFSEIKLPEAQRSNPKQEVLNNLLLNVSISADEYSYLDTKLNDVWLTYRRDFKVVEELELSDKRRDRSVSCEKQGGTGVICTCSKK